MYYAVQILGIPATISLILGLTCLLNYFYHSEITPAWDTKTRRHIRRLRVAAIGGICVGLAIVLLMAWLRIHLPIA